MNEYELLRIIDFIDEMRWAFRKVLPEAQPDPVWAITALLMRRHVEGRPVSISTLNSESGLPYATGLRMVHRMIAEGQIVKVPRSKSGRSFDLVPSPQLILGFEKHARQTKALLARLMGLRIGQDDNQYYFGGTPREIPPSPPLRLMQMAGQPGQELRFLLNADNYFSGMRNMWIDFRNNLASGRNFDLVPLTDLHDTIIANARKAVSDYDVIAVNLPWLGNLAEAGVIKPLTSHIAESGIEPLDFHPAIWSSVRWQGQDYGVPAFCTVGTLAARRDMFEDHGIAMPQSFDDVIAAGTRFHNPAAGKYGIVWDGARGMPIASSFLFFLGSCGQPPITMRRTQRGFTLEGFDPATAASTIASEAGLTALDFMARLKSISPPGILDMAWDAGLEVFLRGQASMGYLWTMRAGRLEYDVHSVVKRRVSYLPQPSGPRGMRGSPLGGFMFCIPANLPEDRVPMAMEAIAWMTSREAMQTHVKNGLPVAPRFSVSADPEAAAISPVIQFVDRLARTDMLRMWNRPAIPAYMAIEQILGSDVHDALLGRASFAEALERAAHKIEQALRTSAAGDPP